MSPKTKTKRPHGPLRRGVYLLPSLFTIGNMLLGFYAIICGFRGYVSGDDSLFLRAAVLVFAAGVVDGLDGRIARMVGMESEFGREYDSMADAVTFGMTPALLCYFWGLHEFGRVGWLVPLFYLICCLTRLARFNVQTQVLDHRDFVGLPTPAAAGAICALLFFAPESDWKPYGVGLLMAALVLLGSLMVSTFRYKSFKKIDLKQRRSYRTLIPVAAVVLVTAVHPPAFFLAVAVIYTVSGPLGWAWGRLRPKQGDGAADGEGDETATTEVAP
ncbi:MAG TPA: CDP-diacylglycerol--serine O-phosphatidyltransferase [Thermoanaerobaculia bacterium]|nr:CDP-diacylglycerol--serine O-phosphatidyltransferase [Thermoanaerobaculia bacterium]